MARRQKKRKQGKPSARALAKRARAEAALTLRSLPAQEEAGQVHDIRVLVKVLRSLGRLARQAGMAGEKRFDRKLQAVARSLSASRDSQVAGEWLKAHAFPHPASGGHPDLRRAKARLRAAEKEFLSALERSSLSPEQLAAGLKESARQVRKTERRARRSRSDSDFHSWRKRAKNLQYQLRLLGGSAGALDQVGKRLGKIQDRVIVGKFLERLPAADWKSKARRLARREKRRLQKKALADFQKLVPGDLTGWVVRQSRA